MMTQQPARRPAFFQTLVSLGRPMVYYPALNALTGSVEATLLLCQMAYWWPLAADPRGIYRTRDEWRAEMGFSERQLDGARAALRDRGLIVETTERLAHRTYYRPVEETIDARWNACCEPVSGTEKPEAVDSRVYETSIRESPPSSAPESTDRGRPNRQNVDSSIKQRSHTEMTPKISGRSTDPGVRRNDLDPSTKSGGSRSRPLAEPPDEPFDDNFVRRMTERFGLALGGEAGIRERIAEALNHASASRWKNKQLGVTGWLRRDAEHAGRQGSPRPLDRRTPPHDDSPEYWEEQERRLRAEGLVR